ncbi:hypothetical protein P171DRAFT_436271 [Karstenula rhodostoma CBS 690.94]|uniref:Rhodopsin domain-containing protein n=1 Tax=Karstenula rhodostoma CBS 690.94 TaxID=1392251 RepID=A0A9P4U619_9PLEO|nr:hypothetical protein P171DRAFT_436271 [Karstenula rhodostoma CBS 690.94]
MYYGMDTLEKRRTAPMGDRGTVVNIVSWLLTVVAICLLTARFTMRLSIKDKTRRFGLHDLFIVLAFLFSVGQTIAVSVESIQALGQHITELSPNQIMIFQKTEYASCILYIASMGCARISLCLLIKDILPGSVARFTALGFAAFTALWTVTGVLVAAFLCPSPNPWQRGNGKKRLEISSWVNYVGSTNIVVEILLIMIPLCVWNVRTSAGRRIYVSLLFVSRLSVVAAVSAQLHFFNARHTEDFTYESWRTVLCIQIAQNLSIITACLPSLHPFIVKMLAGSIKSEEILTCGEHSPLVSWLTGRRAFDSMSSQSSSMPIKQEKKEEYCAPLATYGLDRASTHLISPQSNRFPLNIATPRASPEPPKDVFMRSVEIPTSASRSASLRRKSTVRTVRNSIGIPEIPEIPKSLAEVGVLPLIDFDADSNTSDRRSKTSSQQSRRPPSDYVFSRSKVISVPDESFLRDQREEGQYYKKYYPPLPSPKTPRKPPRAF